LIVHRETLTQYITFKRGGERGVCTLVLCSLATVTSCVVCADSEKIPEVGTSTYILHLSWKEGKGLISSLELLRLIEKTPADLDPAKLTGSVRGST
jgi:hypothetical protein